jgi:outer membrane protein OmpA-like peptidoglycan-associated protein
MKRKLFCLLCMVGSIAIFSVQGEVKSKNADPGQTACAAIPLSHWSFALKGGLSYFNVAPPSSTSSDKYKTTLGGVIDYTFNPFIGLGIEYDNSDYSHPYSYLGTNGNVKGWTNDFILYGSVNLSNALAPFRAWKGLNVYGNVGAGVAYYNNALDDAPAKDYSSMMGKLGLNAEISLGESFNLCIAGQYHQYESRTLGGAIGNRNSDAMIYTVGLRCKINSSTKMHARNISLCEYSPKPIPVITKKTYVKGETEETLAHLKTVEKENAALKQKIQKMDEDAKNAAMQKALAAQTALQKKVQDLEAKAKDAAREAALKTSMADSLLQAKMKKMEEDLKQLATQKEGVVNLTLDNIEFKTGSSMLAKSSYAILDQVAGILKSNAQWNALKVSGHTDDVGSASSNQKLSESRALSVKKYLVSKGLPANKLVSLGWGESKPVAPNTTAEGRQKNRRVEFEIK